MKYLKKLSLAIEKRNCVVVLVSAKSSMNISDFFNSIIKQLIKCNEKQDKTNFSRRGKRPKTNP